MTKFWKTVVVATAVLVAWIVLMRAVHMKPALERTRQESQKAWVALKKQLEEANQSKTQLTQELTHSNEKIAQLTQQWDQMNRSNTQLNQELARLNEKIDQLTTPPSPKEAKTLQQKLKLQEQELRRLGGLKEQLAQEQSAKSQLTQEGQGLRRQVGETTKQLRTVSQESSRLQSHLSHLEEQLKQREIALEDSKRSQADARTAGLKLEREFALVSQEHEQEIKRFQREMADSEAARKKLTQALEAAQNGRKEVERMRGELAQANDRIAQLITALDVQEQLSAVQARTVTPKGRLKENP